LGLDEGNASWRKELLVGGNRTARHQHNVQITPWTVLDLAKKHIPRVGIEHAHTFFGVSAEVMAYALQRHGLRGKPSLVQEQAADTAVRMTVRGGVLHPQCLAIRQVNLARALHMQEKTVDGIPQPDELQIPSLQLAVGIDLTPGEIRHYLPLVIPSDQTLPGIATAKRAEINVQEVGWGNIHRIDEL
jgi:hypothetical protein